MHEIDPNLNYTIIDCYTDEPSGLGVPPYIGTFPRYIYGALKDKGIEAKYLTIDDIRLLKKYDGKKPNKSEEMKTNIKIYNLTKNTDNSEEILNNTDVLIIISGINVPGKYLSAVPGTLPEITDYIKDLKCYKILAGPAALVGSRTEGGKMPEKFDVTVYDEKNFNLFKVNSYKDIKGDLGAGVLNQIPWQVIAELETGRGCDIGRCSFCTEPIKSKVFFRKQEDVISEIKALGEIGVKHFRFGKQTCFLSYEYGDKEAIENLLKTAAEFKPKTLHIDNVNPNKVVGKDGEKLVQLLVKYCTEGNVCAFGVESFDPKVVKANYLNTMPIIARKAVEIVNKYGKERGPNGMQKLLPGINIIFGLMDENKETHEKNMEALQYFLDNDLLLRRVNIRQVVPYEGTMLYDRVGNKFVKKNKKHYFGWRRDIREKFDHEMLKKLVPVGTILSDVYAEIYDGKTTFARQFGTYPLVVGIKGQRVELGKYYKIRVIGHMLRSIVGELVEEQ